jgi:hypothetical protein
MSATGVLIIRCDASVLNDLSKLLREAEVTAETSPQRHLDGAQVNDWVVLAAVAARTAPAVLNALSRFLTRNNLASVRYGDVEIKNPRPEDVPALAAAIERARDET